MKLTASFCDIFHTETEFNVADGCGLIVDHHILHGDFNIHQLTIDQEIFQKFVFSVCWSHCIYLAVKLSINLVNLYFNEKYFSSMFIGENCLLYVGAQAPDLQCSYWLFG